MDYEIKKDLEELEAGQAQENAYNVWVEHCCVLTKMELHWLLNEKDTIITFLT